MQKDTNDRFPRAVSTFDKNLKASTVPNNNKISAANQSIELNMLYSNIRSLKNKISELNFVMSECNTDICCLTESWLNDTVLDSMISSNSYSVFRKDRPINKMGGGVAIICKNNPKFL